MRNVADMTFLNKQELVLNKHPNLGSINKVQVSTLSQLKNEAAYLQHLRLQDLCPFCSSVYKKYSPVIELVFILKHSKRFHGLYELLGIHVVNLSGKGQANRGCDSIVFLRLLPAKHIVIVSGDGNKE